MSEKKATTLAQALLKAQQAMHNPKMTGKNPHFKSKFAPLDSVLEACKKPLNDNGLTLLQPPVKSEGGVGVKTIILHESGESMDLGELHIPVAQADAQKYVAALTYARRASASSAFSLAGDEDTDGNGLGDQTNDDKRSDRKPSAKETTGKVGSDVQAKKGNPPNFKFLQSLKPLKKEMGDEAYYQVLGNHGYEHANEIADRSHQIAVFKEMDMVAKATLEMNEEAI